ncbi:hypothetical protein FJ945_19685 [Mesorhizobium sp. B2-4-9]|uniref:hypothetical protein n=1 Tax=Mesorhizobium sp. B2-4-9 TaxID=2589940 RepID=UPI00112B241C|nr:hypothetical protein [Mesorhizobium sp. B2-4-9]TPL20969.1 hypothetical protein FJ945_19685 [Mesorhizobium sp. B2-4-9]
MARNECGFDSALSFQKNRVVATDWKLVGIVSPGMKSITWKNGAVWVKQPPEATEIEKRIGYWESQTFYCGDKKQHFPSKEDEGDGAPKCDDGDSVMFNALLCRGGDQRGCNAVAASQDRDGRFWRSPAKMLTRPEEPADPLKGGQTTFSGDHALGLFLYFSATSDSAAFKKWIAWIDRNERCYTWCNGMPIGTPRYCKNDRCSFAIGDCQVLLLLGARMDVGIPFCSVDPFTSLPTVTNAAMNLKATHDAMMKALKFRPPGIEIVENVFNESLRVYESAVAPVEALKTMLEAKLVEALLIEQIRATFSAKVNARGYSRHNALVRVMLLEDMGLGADWMDDIVKDIAKDEPANPFFQYVAFRRTNKAPMLDLILKECPSTEKDAHNRRTQWSWERDSAKAEWVNTMYWDCLFASRVYLETRFVPSNQKYITNDLAMAALGSAVAKLQDLRKLVEIALEQLRRVAAIGADPTKAITDIIADPFAAAKAQLELVKTEAAELQKLTNKSLKEVAELSDAVINLLPRVADLKIEIPELKLPTKPSDIIPSKASDVLPQFKIGDGKAEVNYKLPGKIKVKIGIHDPTGIF